MATGFLVGVAPRHGRTSSSLTRLAADVLRCHAACNAGTRRKRQETRGQAARQRAAAEANVRTHIRRPAMLEKLLSMIMDWRNLPAYRLEPRFDPFIAYYLPEIFTKLLTNKTYKFIIPELPLQRGMLYGANEASKNKSVKVDFALISFDRRSVILVEVKTDDSSRREEQDDYLKIAEQRGWLRIIEGILAIARATPDEYVAKYDKLLQIMSRLEYINYSVDDASDTRSIKRAILSATPSQLCDSVDLAVYFVQPTGDAKNVINFLQFADFIDQSSDPFAPIIAKAFRRLTIPAGQSGETLLNAF